MLNILKYIDDPRILFSIDKKFNIHKHSANIYRPLLCSKNHSGCGGVMGSILKQSL